MNRLVVPALLAAVVVFIWMFISWAVIGWHDLEIKSFPDATEIEHMKAVMHEPGIYVYPGYPEEDSESAMKEWTDKYEAGPIISFMVYSPTGGNPWDMMLCVRSFIINFIAAFLAGALLMMTLAQNPNFWRRVTFVMLLGLFAGFIGPVIEWNWWGFPLGYTIVMVIDFCITWFLAGLILAWRIKPEAETQTA